MTDPYEKSAAVVVLPAVTGGRLGDATLRRWLSRANLQAVDGPKALLGSLLGTLNLPCPTEGLGALRMWGQTGDRPTVWIAAADPVYLEPRLDHLCLHAPAPGAIPASDLRPLIDHLQRTLVDSENYGFARVGPCGYLRAEEAFATADVPANIVDQRRPEDFMPSGKDAAGYRGLVSEVEMALHDHEVNLRRQSDGLNPINCLWLWGGGFAPEQQTVPHPPLYANDPLLKGHWLSRTAVVAPWPGSIEECLDASVAGFVAVVPDEDKPELLEYCLRELRDALVSGRLSRLTLMFRDGIDAEVKLADRWRVWRRSAALLK